jgi:hypothetical protein
VSILHHRNDDTDEAWNQKAKIHREIKTPMATTPPTNDKEKNQQVMGPGVTQEPVKLKKRR